VHVVVNGFWEGVVLQAQPPASRAVHLSAEHEQFP